MRGIILIVLAVMCLGVGTAAAFDLSIAWNNTYGDEETNESAYSIIQTENASLIFAGDTDVKGAGLADAWLVLLDEEEGTLLSDAAYGTVLNETAFDVIQSDDGTIVFAGSTVLPLEADLYHADAWVVGINATGEEELNRTFGGPEVNASAYTIIQTTDGGYLFVGSIEGYESGNTDAWMMKINATGEEEWNSRFGGDQNESAFSVIEDNEGNFLFTGYTESYDAGEADGWVVKTNSTGMELWNATFGGAGNDTGWDIFQENEQNFSFVGTTTFFTGENRTDTDAWYLRFNATGAPLLEATYGGPDVNATARSAVETPDGGRLVAGSIEDYGSGNRDAWLIKLDTSAEEEWNGALGGPLQDLARSVIRISETSYVFAGEFNGTLEAQPPYPDAWVVRLDEVIEPAPTPAPGPTPPKPVPKPIPRGKIGDRVWEDRNSNGIQDDGEPGIKGVKVILSDADDVQIRSRTTDSEGHYCFCSLKPGTYSLRFIRPEGYVFTLEEQGDDPALDSDANIDTGRAGPIDLAENEKDRTWDAGLVNVSTIRIDVEKATNGEDADEAPGPSIPVNATVNWTYNVTNTGSVPLFEVTLNDDILGAVSGPSMGDDADGVLESGETWVYEANGTAEAGSYENLATVSGTFSTATTEDSDPSHYNGTGAFEAMIELETYIYDPASHTYVEADDPPGVVFESEDPGISIAYTVTNTGNVDLINVEIDDIVDYCAGSPNPEVCGAPSGDIGNDGILSPGETWDYTFPEELVDAVVCQQEDRLKSWTATVTAQDLAGNEVTDTDVAYYTMPPCGAIDLEKYVNGEDADTPPGVIFENANDTVNITYTVTSTGVNPLGNVVLTDPMVTIEGPLDDNGDGVLGERETWSYRVQPGDEPTAGTGEHMNTATVTAQGSWYYGSFNVNDTDVAYWTGPEAGGAGAIELDNYLNGEDADTPPGVIFDSADAEMDLTYTVTNTGEVDLINVEIEDLVDICAPYVGTPDDCGPIGDIGNDGILSPGETWNYDMPMQEEPDPGCGPGPRGITDRVTALDPEGNEVTDTDVVYYTPVPCAAIDLEKYVNGEDADGLPELIIDPDEEIIITYTVTNKGALALTNVVLEDEYHPVTGPIDDDGDGILSPGETWNYRVQPGNEPVAEPGLNYDIATVTAQDVEGTEVTDTDGVIWFVPEPGGAAIELNNYINGKDADTPPGFVCEFEGQGLDFTYTVTNTGDVDLTNVEIVTIRGACPPDECGPFGDIGNDGILSPGETWNYDLPMGEEPDSDCGPEPRGTTDRVTAQDPEGNEVTFTDVAYYTPVPCAAMPAIGLEVQVENETNPASPGPDVPVGTPVSLFFYVTNTGEVGLTNVALSADGFTASGTGEGDDGNDILDPGETWGYETSVEAVEGIQQIDASATAEDSEGNEVTDSITVYYTGIVEEETPTEEMTPEEEETPAEEMTPEEEETPAENMTPQEEETPAEEMTPEEEETPAENMTP